MHRTKYYSIQGLLELISKLVEKRDKTLIIDKYIFENFHLKIWVFHESLDKEKINQITIFKIQDIDYEYIVCSSHISPYQIESIDEINKEILNMLKFYHPVDVNNEYNFEDFEIWNMVEEQLLLES